MLIKKKVLQGLGQDLAEQFESMPDIEEAKTETATAPEILDAKAEAAQILERAQAAAEQIHKKAAAEADLLWQKAEQKAEEILGNVQAQIEEQVAERVAFKLEQLENLQNQALSELEALAGGQKQIIQNSQETIVNVAIQLASNLLQEKIKTEPKLIEKQFKRAIQETLNSTTEENITATMLIHPQDRELAAQFVANLKEEKLELNLKEDESITPGSCMIEGPVGTLDLNFSSQLTIFREKILNS